VWFPSLEGLGVGLIKGKRINSPDSPFEGGKGDVKKEKV